MSLSLKASVNSPPFSHFYFVQNWQYITLFIVISFIVGLSVYSNLYNLINGDVAWYIISVEKLLAGQTNTEAYFDTNPPMSFLIYIPISLLHWVTGLSQITTLNIYIITLTLVLHLLALRLLSELFNTNKIIPYGTIITSIFSIFIFNNVSGTKEQFICIPITPLIAALYYLHEGRTRQNTLAYSLIALCSLIMLVKPHYFLIPGIIFLFYMIKTKRLSSVTIKCGLIILAIIAAYAFLVVMLFPDFLTNILPISSDLYVSHLPLLQYDQLYLPFITLILVCLFLCGHILLIGEYPHKNFFTLLILTFIPAYIAFLIQGKGFWVHHIPFLHTALLAITLYFLHLMQKLIREHILITTYTAFILYASCLIALNFSYQQTVVYQNLLSFKNLLNQKDIRTFYVESQATALPYITALEDNRIHASRFPSRWILDGVETYKDIPPEKKEFYINLFATMFVEDIEKYQPEILFLYDPGISTKNSLYNDYKHYGILEYLQDNDRFLALMEHYEKTGEEFYYYYSLEEYNKDLHFTKYIIYKRKDAYKS